MQIPGVSHRLLIHRIPNRLPDIHVQLLGLGVTVGRENQNFHGRSIQAIHGDGQTTDTANTDQRIRPLVNIRDHRNNLHPGKGVTEDRKQDGFNTRHASRNPPPPLAFRRTYFPSTHTLRFLLWKCPYSIATAFPLSSTSQTAASMSP